MLLPTDSFRNKHVHIVGIKGTGCAALVELLLQQGCHVSGSDTPDVFYTDAILKELGISYYESFDAAHVAESVQFLVHSAAYGPENPEIQAALTRGIPVLNYPQALGQFSHMHHSVAIAGVHGKTTTTALCGVIAQALNIQYDLGASILVGSAVPAFGNRAVLSTKGDFFIAETCEYRRHFLEFSPKIVLLTAIEWDHQDYFKKEEDIFDAFITLCQKLPKNGHIVYCHDDKGVRKVMDIIAKDRPDLSLIPYGWTAGGLWGISTPESTQEQGKPLSVCTLSAHDCTLKLQVPGDHNLVNATGALAVFSLLMNEKMPEVETSEWLPLALASLIHFSGTKRRSEIVCRTPGVLVMDDYGHHPTAITTTLAGIKSFYRPKRLVVSFMSHTFSRTAAQLDEFAQSLDSADVLILHKIYASAREVFDGKIDGMTLYHACQKRRPERPIHYTELPLEALDLLKDILEEGDLFLTLGAGDNFHLSHTYCKEVLACTA